MAAQISFLVDKVDNSELIRDQIARILLEETASQKALAQAQSQDPRLWALRVFTERSSPWGEFQDLAEDSDYLDVAPLVNVSFDTSSVDLGASNLIERQKFVGTFNLDCYAYGHAANNEAGGHYAGDEMAALVAQRAARHVRNYLMSSHYAYLGLPRGANQVVWRRWTQSITSFKPQFDDTALQQIAAVRIALQVEYSEFAPQAQPELLEMIAVTVRRAETGEVYLTAEYEYGDS